MNNNTCAFPARQNKTKTIKIHSCTLEIKFVFLVALFSEDNKESLKLVEVTRSVSLVLFVFHGCVKPKLNTRRVSARLCNFSPQHRCYQSLWLRSQSERNHCVSATSKRALSIFTASALWRKGKKKHLLVLTNCDSDFSFFLFYLIIFWWSGTLPSTIIHSFPVWRVEPASLLLASDIGSSWGAVIIILTVPEPTGALVDTKYQAAPGVWAKLKKTHMKQEKKKITRSNNTWLLCVKTKCKWKRSESEWQSSFS